MGAQGKAYVLANYSWERAARETSDLLRELTVGAAR
jgi:hypothetical protein